MYSTPLSLHTGYSTENIPHGFPHAYTAITGIRSWNEDLGSGSGLQRNSRHMSRARIDGLGSNSLFLGIEQYPAIRLRQDGLNQLAVKGVSRPIRRQVPNDRHPEQGHIPDQVQDFMPHEFIRKPKDRTR